MASEPLMPHLSMRRNPGKKRKEKPFFPDSIYRWMAQKASEFSLTRLSATSVRLSEPTSLRAQMLVSSPGTWHPGFIGNVLSTIELAKKKGEQVPSLSQSQISPLTSSLNANSLALRLKLLPFTHFLTSLPKDPIIYEFTIVVGEILRLAGTIHFKRGKRRFRLLRKPIPWTLTR